MKPDPTPSTVSERELLEAARRGDEDAYGRLVGQYRAELHAHCYRMLGSVPDAEDALQEALLRAWRGLPRFEGRSSLRSWLYKIATNACLRLIERRPRRVLPIDYGPEADPHDGPGEPLVESVWVDPYPDAKLGLEDGPAGPEARYEQRESVELAFIAALQHLPARQRAVLILRDVLGFSAREVAEALETTPASVDSALQRAHKSVDERLPEQSQQATLRSLGDVALRDVVERYVDAWERGDVEAVVAMLAENATIAMPPMPTW
jgi:RNA polymerase sigma-70 factor (ECF subfamily)